MRRRDLLRAIKSGRLVDVKACSDKFNIYPAMTGAKVIREAHCSTKGVPDWRVECGDISTPVKASDIRPHVEGGAWTKKAFTPQKLPPVAPYDPYTGSLEWAIEQAKAGKWLELGSPDGCRWKFDGGEWFSSTDCGKNWHKDGCIFARSSKWRISKEQPAAWVPQVGDLVDCDEDKEEFTSIVTAGKVLSGQGDECLIKGALYRGEYAFPEKEASYVRTKFIRPHVPAAKEAPKVGSAEWAEEMGKQGKKVKHTSMAGNWIELRPDGKWYFDDGCMVSPKGEGPVSKLPKWKEGTFWSIYDDKKCEKCGQMIPEKNDLRSRAMYYLARTDDVGYQDRADAIIAMVRAEIEKEGKAK